MTSDAEHDGPSHSQSPEEGGEEQENGEHAENQDMEERSGDQGKDGQQKKPASNAKDPSRPRRKKARRACYACQRAHLTCGDERPCQRCIKRGLQDACADGVRKKAKYLHDAPNEALVPGGASHYQYMNSFRRPQQQQQQQPQQQPQSQSPTYPINSGNEIYAQSQAAQSYPVYGSASATLSEAVMNPSAYAQQSPLAGRFPASQPQAQMSELVQQLPQSTSQDPNSLQSYDSAMFDANDMNQYDFDPTVFNFGNHYGALEFGMLGQISSGAAETPPGENGSQLGQNGTNNLATPGTLSTQYSGSPVSSMQPFAYNQDQNMNEWGAPPQPQSNMRQSVGGEGFSISRDANGRIKEAPPSAFSIGVNSAFATPTDGRSPQEPAKQGLENSSNKGQAYSSESSGRLGAQAGQPSASSKSLQPGSQQFLGTAQFTTSRRRGDPSLIYEKVTQPYSYTTGFHLLIAFLKRRFSSQKTLKIAKALASIRPSFITCTKTLGREDLVFMEKCFQRSLFEYEDYISACGTPTLICRRTGEIVAVGKEFSILTGWRRDVLLGNEANLNINTGGSSGASTAASSRGGINTPRLPEGAIDSSHPQPVFVAEVLDDDSVVQFYEDFARLAFGDSHGVVYSTCKLLKYQTKDDNPSSEQTLLKRKRGRLPGKSDIAGEAGIDELADKDGKVECSFCWTVKRDLFDLPMMIVMNFLPCI